MADSVLALFLSLCSFGILAADSSSTEPFGLRLVGGASRCLGELEVRGQGRNWTSVNPSECNLQFANKVCAELDCGSAVSVRKKWGLKRETLRINPHCEETSLSNCFLSFTSPSDSSLEMKCSDSVRLHGPSLCSGSLELRQNQSWTPVCEGDFDLQDAQVVCRELGCGAPSLLQRALYGEGQALRQTFQCEGHESALMDCPRSSSGNTCSSGTAVELTCSEPLRLVGGASRCAGTVELRVRGDWRPVHAVYRLWDLEATAAVCRDLDCGSAVFGEIRGGFPVRPVWMIRSDCVKKSALRDCVKGLDHRGNTGLDVVCSDSARLHGPSLCSGSLELHQNQSWTPVCEGDFDLQDAQVVCRELGCGAPSLLQRALYGEGQALGQTFLCEGHESALMDCPRSSSGNTCSSGTAVELTCSEPVRLVGGASRCAGTVELRLGGDWRPVDVDELFGDWDLEATAAMCRDLDCGSAVFGERRDGFPVRLVWRVTADCVKKSALRHCVLDVDHTANRGLEVVCSDLLTRPNIFLSVSADGVSEAQPQGLRVLLGSDFSVRCSVEPQYPGGSFQLISPTVDPAQNHILPAVNHSAHFLFFDAGPAHKGGYTCVYRLHVFSHNFSSQSHTLYLTLGALDSELIIRVVIILLLQPIYITALYYYYCKATRGRQRRPQRTSPEEHS